MLNLWQCSLRTTDIVHDKPALITEEIKLVMVQSNFKTKLLQTDQLKDENLSTVSLKVYFLVCKYMQLPLEIQGFHGFVYIFLTFRPF